jgi:hypothetical protein
VIIGAFNAKATRSPSHKASFACDEEVVQAKINCFSYSMKRIFVKQIFAKKESYNVN